MRYSIGSGRSFLIVNIVIYHDVKCFKLFHEANKDKLWLFHLPHYSAKLNPVELAWHETERNATYDG